MNHSGDIYDALTQALGIVPGRGRSSIFREQGTGPFPACAVWQGEEPGVAPRGEGRRTWVLDTELPAGKAPD